jgi:hypothetical protein
MWGGEVLPATRSKVYWSRSRERESVCVFVSSKSRAQRIIMHGRLLLLFLSTILKVLLIGVNFNETLASCTAKFFSSLVN